jgi:hypothetical protein
MVRARMFADFETPYDVLNLVRFGYVGFAGRGHEVRRHHLNKIRGRMIGHRLKLNLQTVYMDFGFPIVWESDI